MPNKIAASVCVRPSTFSLRNFICSSVNFTDLLGFCEILSAISLILFRYAKIKYQKYKKQIISTKSIKYYCNDDALKR
jgi:hypothetical protein